jgi:hypothetical protein
MLENGARIVLNFMWICQEAENVIVRVQARVVSEVRIGSLGDFQGQKTANSTLKMTD